MTDPIKITGEFTPDPNVCKFIIDRPLLEDWTLVFRSKEESLGSPLVDALFEIDGIERIKVSGLTVTVTKKDQAAWPDLARQVVPAVRKVLETGASPISEEALAAVQSSSSDEIGGAIEQLFDTHINPAIASHGGFVHLVKVEDNDVYLEMGGGCQGCSASQATLRHGIETAIREVAPQVRHVIDVTDHDAGTNPYYH